MQNIFSLLKIVTLLTLSACIGQNQSLNKTLNKASSLGNTVDQLPQNIWHIFQDSKGGYWFGSNGEGVFHFNGQELRRISEKDGLLDNAIRGIQEDHMGNLYFETPKGVNKYDGNALHPLPIYSSPDNKWQMDSLDLWFTCNASAHDVYRYDGTALIELLLPRQDLSEIYGYEVPGLGFKDMNNSPYAVFSIDRDASGNLWLGTITGGAFRYDGTSFLWIGEKDLGILPDGRVPGLRSILQDKDGYMWLSHFVWKYKITENESSPPFESESGFDLSKYDDLQDVPYFNSGVIYNEKIMVSTYADGIWAFDEDQLIPIPIDSGSKKVYLVSMYVDKENRIWLATDNDGPYYYDGSRFIKFSLKHSID